MTVVMFLEIMLNTSGLKNIYLCLWANLVLIIVNLEIISVTKDLMRKSK